MAQTRVRTNGRTRTKDNGSVQPSGGAAPPATLSPSRLGVLKTYKLYIGGKFPRTESGRCEVFRAGDGRLLANVCRASRKDFRDSVVAARAAFPGWAGRSAYNRGQILYRIAEMVEGRAAQFVAEMVDCGLTHDTAHAEVAAAADRLVHYAGWADKFQQLFSSVNPVASAHFNFSAPEPTGVVAVLAPTDSPLAGLVGALAPAVTAGNAAVVVASPRFPLTAITFAEALHTSDLPGGVVNLLTGRAGELVEHIGAHMDVNAVVCCDGDDKNLRSLRLKAAGNLKRVVVHEFADWLADEAQGPYMIRDTVETKTTWHPVGW